MNRQQTVPVFFVRGNEGGRTRQTLGSISVLEEAAKLRGQGEDTLLVAECSGTDAQHEQSILVMKELVRRLDLSLYVCGSVHRLEDIKKYLYAGAAGVFCDTASPAEMSVFEEGKKRFGEDKVLSMDVEAALRQEDGGTVLARELLRAEPVQAQFSWQDVKVNEQGMIPVIAQDYRTNEVLMLAYMNEEAYNLTVQTGRMTYFSRSRNELWVKGLTSGHFQYVKGLYLDCDRDTLLAKVYQVGSACHTGAYSCFFNTVLEKPVHTVNPHKVLEDVMAVILDRREHPKEGSYTNYLFDKGIDKILKKCGEEAAEIIIAAKNPNPEEIKYEISDFLYHVMVLMAEKGVSWEDIMVELANR